MYWEYASKAINLAEQILPRLKALQVNRHRHGPVDVIVTYEGLVIDNVHYDPYTNTPSPKGRPIEYPSKINQEQVLENINRVLEEAYVLKDAEYRKPEDEWIVPVAWRNMIILHLRISGDGGRLVADPGL